MTAKTCKDIPGWSGFLWLYDEFVEKAPKGAILVEVGVAMGHSLAHVARAAIDAKRDDIEIWGIDPWDGHGRNGEQQAVLGPEPGKGDFELFVRTMLDHAPEELERIRIVRANSEQACNLFTEMSLDLVLIDGCHDAKSVSADIGVWLDFIKEDGVLAGDDHEPNYPGVEQACRLAFGNDYVVKGSTWIKRFK
jgi:hypothetical protein